MNQIKKNTTSTTRHFKIKPMVILLTLALYLTTSVQSQSSSPSIAKSKPKSKKVSSSSGSITSPELLNKDKNFLTEKELFSIEVLDHSKPEDRQKIFEIIFSSQSNSTEDPKINKKRMLVLLYKFLLDESFERVQEIERK